MPRALLLRSATKSSTSVALPQADDSHNGSLYNGCEGCLEQPLETTTLPLPLPDDDDDDDRDEEEGDADADLFPLLFTGTNDPSSRGTLHR